MKRMAWLLVVALALATPASGAELMSRTFAAPIDRVWVVSEAVLKHLGWGIDKADRTIGFITTGARRVEGEDYGVYAKGVVHRLQLQIRPSADGRTTVSVERTVFKRERILWMDKDEPVTATDSTVETALLDAIGKAL
jgi:hypothetical protein